MLLPGLVLLILSVLLIVYRKKVVAKVPKNVAIVLIILALLTVGYYFISFFINPTGY